MRISCQIGTMPATPSAASRRSKAATSARWRGRAGEPGVVVGGGLAGGEAGIVAVVGLVGEQRIDGRRRGGRDGPRVGATGAVGAAGWARAGPTGSCESTAPGTMASVAAIAAARISFSISRR